MKVTDNIGKECDLTPEVEEIIFQEDVRLVRHLREVNVEDDEIYETLEEIFESRSERGVPNTLTKALFILYKISADQRTKEIGNRIAAGENLEHALSMATNRDTSKAIHKAIEHLQRELL